MRCAARLASGLLIGLVLAPGCQRLNDERTVHLDPTEIHEMEFDPPRYEQKLTVTVQSSGFPVSAYLVRTEDKDPAITGLNKDQVLSSVLAKQEKATDMTLSATIPAKTGFTLLLKAGTKGADVKVKTVGR